jgi:hypothetical protein
MALGQPRALDNTTRKPFVVSANKVNMGRYKFRLKGRNTVDMPAIVEPIEPEPSGMRPIMAAVVFTEGGGFELRPLQGCSAEDVPD